MALALQHDSRVIFERFVRGQEVECAVRGNDDVASTLPGFTDISMYPKLMLAAGESYAGLLDSLIALALERAAKSHGDGE